MTNYEEQLNRVTAPGAYNDWDIKHLAEIREELASLKELMGQVAKSPGWTGDSATAASVHFKTIQKDISDVEVKLAIVDRAIKDANQIRSDAASAKSNLPDATVPEWIHKAAEVGGAIPVPVIGIGTFFASVVVDKVEEFLGAQREAKALEQLEQLEKKLQPQAAKIKGAALTPEEWPDPPAVPDYPGPGVVYTGDSDGKGSWSTRTGGGNPGGGGTTVSKPPTVWTGDWPPIDGPPNPPIVSPPPPVNWPPTQPPTISVDGGVDTGTTLTGSSNGGGIGGGFGAGLVGAGAGAGALGASRLAASGAGGASSLLGPGGLLGGGAGGSGSGGAGAAGSGAGAKGGSAMMGGSPGGAGGSDKEKRSGLGLMAPKLEDDEENGPRAAAAGAGGRE